MRKGSRMKRIITLLLMAVLISSALVLAAAQTTMLTTTVPSRHTVSITIYGRGRVIVDGTRRIATGTVSVKRHSTPVVTVKARYGYELASLSYNGGNIANKLVDDSWTMPAAQYDSEIAAVFVRDEKIDLTYRELDMQALYEYLSAGTMPPKDLDFYEVNGDGDINILDYQAMYEIIKNPA